MNIELIFKKLNEKGISVILIGGRALFKYGSDRVTFDTDIVAKTIEIDKIIEVFYECNFLMLIGINKEDNNLILENNITKAIEFANKSNWGFLKFLSENEEIDVIYETCIPFMRLYQDSVEENIGDIKIRIASLEHLKILKEKSLENRSDDEKKVTDRLDLDFINKKLWKK